jgi:hypothetical protein
MAMSGRTGEEAMTEPKPLKVSVTVTVVLKDPEHWTTTFGVERRADIRNDVKGYVLNMVQNSGVFGSGEVDAEIS